MLDCCTRCLEQSEAWFAQELPVLLPQAKPTMPRAKLATFVEQKRGEKTVIRGKIWKSASHKWITEQIKKQWRYQEVGKDKGKPCVA